ncbi:MAG: hypothetical protein AB7H97_20595 [Pseudobdellovibrionaceae bacterium]
MLQIAQNLILALVLSCTSFAMAKEASGDPKTEALQSLQGMRSENVNRLKDIDRALSKRIEEGRPGNVEKEVSTLRTARKEHVLRQDFLDRLILQIDKNFRGGDLRQFLQVALTEMAKTDAMGPNSEASLWKFLKYAAEAIGSIPERKENIIAFLEGYMNRSVSDPIKPQDYLNSRNYTNGSMSEQGHPMKSEEVGDVADQRLQELNESIEPEQKSTIPAPQVIKSTPN